MRRIAASPGCAGWGAMGKKMDLASTAVSRDLVQEIASELAFGIERAVDCWMAQVEQALTDTRLTSLGRLYAAREIVERYKTLSGKAHLEGRPA
jgi:hypothetical protein